MRKVSAEILKEGNGVVEGSYRVKARRRKWGRRGKCSCVKISAEEAEDEASEQSEQLE
jgi:hypothetical protein